MSMTIRKAALLAAATIAASALTTTSAWAAETFNFTGANTNTSSNYGNVRTFTGSDGTKVEATAYSLSGSALTTSFVGQYLGNGAGQYGLGVSSRDNNDDHAIDNNGRIDFVVLQFDKMVSVSQLGIYGFGDTDLTWAVGSTNTLFSNVLSIPNYTTLDNLFLPFNISTGPTSTTLQTRSVNGTALTGNLFLVAASTATNSGRNDDFKLSSLTATAVPVVPEPGTWAMMIGGFALTGAAMRRRKTSTSVSFA